MLCTHRMEVVTILTMLLLRMVLCPACGLNQCWAGSDLMDATRGSRLERSLVDTGAALSASAMHAWPGTFSACGPCCAVLVVITLYSWSWERGWIALINCKGRDAWLHCRAVRPGDAQAGTWASDESSFALRLADASCHERTCGTDMLPRLPK